MNKKLPLIIGIVAVVIVIVVALVVVLNGKKDEGKENGKEEVAQINLEEVSKKITENSAFGKIATEEVTLETLETYFQVKAENVEKVVGKVPLMNVHSSLYVIVEAKEGKVNEVKADLDEFCTQYEQQWEMYLPQQYEYVKDRKTGTIGKYAYVIIAENSKELEEMIK